jgi:sulfatase maturation enzyme AslB (radical SAM superfamily)
LCARETDVEFDKKQHHHLTVAQVATHYDDDFIKNLNKMFMCGVYGDPAAGKYTLDLYRYFRKINTKIMLGMNTNGALQNTIWWHELGHVMNQSHDCVVFSIDGNKDTNHIYRKNVNWERLKHNIEAFVAAGGRAHWDMLVYQYNQHQVDECEQLARDMGFSWFRAKVSRRGFTDTLQQPTAWQSMIVANGNIKCHALQEQSEYMDAQGRVSPCCWLGGTQSKFVTDFDKVQQSWSTHAPNAVCQITCSTHNNQSNFLGQWQREVELV